MDNKEQDSKPAANPNLPLDLDIHNDHHNGHDNDDDDDDDDDDEDNWSRQVERDDITAAGVLLGDSFRMESVAEQDAGSSPGTRDKQETDSDQGRTVGSSTLPLAPTQPELSMKEKLVLRERQRRIETERARLKRQFALNNDQEERPDAAQNHTAVTALSEAAAGSAAGTLGEESTKAHPDEESADQEKLGFNMERFLRNSDTFNPELEPTAEDKPPAQPDQGPVMERFLNDPVVMETDKVEAAVLSRADVQRSVSFDVTDAPLDASEGGGGDGSGGDDGMLPHGIVGSLPSFNEINGSIDANASVLVQADEDDVARDPLTTPMPSMDVQESIADSEDGSAASTEEPRVLRLTEADMQEMAAIEEASIGNAPPSERTEEDLSEIGELAGFGSHNVPDNAGNFSQDTPTTAMESASMHSGNQSAHRASTTTHDHSADQHSLDGMPSMSISSQLLVSPGASGYPPSDTARDEGPPSIDRDIPNNEHVRSEEPQQLALSEHENEDMQLRDRTDSDSANSEGLVNRRMRPGMVNLRPQANHSPIMDRAAASRSPAPPVVVEGFDFDKHEPMSPQTDHEDSLRDLPVDVGWSPAGDTMHVSPIQIRSLAARLPTTEEEPTAGRNNYGSMEEGRAAQGTNLPFAPMPDFKINEIRPLLGSDVPPEIITRRTSSGRSSSFDRTNPRNNSSGMSLASIVETVFHNVQEEEEKEKIRNEAALYEASSVLQKAFPERMFALIVTLIFEIPVLLTISGGSDALCALIGRKRYQLLIGFIPLTSAISGNVGLQSSTLTTRAVSHSHVTPESYIPWFLGEVGAAAWLGLGMGILLGGIGYVASGMDFAFGLTIFIAQFISMLTAGVTGTFAPLLFSFVFKQDAGKWGGPLETAVQDIVGSFSMVVVSYYLLSFFGAGTVAENDTCGV